MADLAALIARVEAASGPDREIDADLIRTLVPGSTVGTYITDDSGDIVFHAEALGIRNKWPAPAYTGSVDPALDLAEHVLPGVWYVLAKGRLSVNEPLYGCELLFGADEQLAIADGPNQPLAIVKALLKALQARAGQ